MTDELDGRARASEAEASRARIEAAEAARERDVARAQLAEERALMEVRTAALAREREKVTAERAEVEELLASHETERRDTLAAVQQFERDLLHRAVELDQAHAAVFAQQRAQVQELEQRERQVVEAEHQAPASEPSLWRESPGDGSADISEAWSRAEAGADPRERGPTGK
jgi:hypothetical protein